MDNKEHIQLINDLVMKTEEGELTWSSSDYAGYFLLKSDEGEITIGKDNKGHIEFIIKNQSMKAVVRERYLNNNDDQVQLYKISNVLWLLVKDVTKENSVDLLEIMNFLEEDEKNEE